MPDVMDSPYSFTLERGAAKRSILLSVEAAIMALLPEAVRGQETVQWVLDPNPSLRETSNHDDLRSGYRESSPARVIAIILQPAIQRRLDFMARSLYPIARAIGVSERAMAGARRGGEPSAVAKTERLLSEDAGLSQAGLPAAASKVLTALLSQAEDMHRRRLETARELLSAWLSEADGFRSAFKPANAALGEASVGRGDFVKVGRSVARLIAYLAQPPQIGSGAAHDDALRGEALSVVLSPGEVAGAFFSLSLVPLAVTRAGYEREWGIDSVHVVHELSSAFHDLAIAPTRRLELEILRQRYADHDPFPRRLEHPPSEELRVEMRRNVLSDGSISPWLAGFLSGFEKVRWWFPPGQMEPGDPSDRKYITSLARSVHDTVIHSLVDQSPNPGETWDEYVERLVVDEWMVRLREWIARSEKSAWTRGKFVAILAAVSDRLCEYGYVLSLDERRLAALWDSRAKN